MAGSWSRLPPNLTREPLLTVSVPTIVSPRHPLATHRAPVPKAVLAEHIQVISMSTIYRTDCPPRPAGRWFIERLEEAITEPPNDKRSPDRRYEHRPPGISDRLVLVKS